MSTTDHGPANGFEPEPEDWPAPDPDSLSREAVENEPDDVVTTLPDDAPLPVDADEADVIEQRTDAGVDVGDEDVDAEDEF
ncbi:hypothetical protein GA707_09950 [Nostocoides sp. F2B08]|uniref:hypothetical protein n=1 Tax=Nostocoides sp. F2B08 TaxID=2653936 RepID=UPI0012639676|nr:hypothetical protein [Tetrasphaera sp. F2B08]KAB7743809.1 hypothetical protein GA707_09950 [Tetrasphaera sp. F2B08]